MAIERYQISIGDTLQQIARRYLGHADQWWILANFNKLDYPFIDTTGTVYPDLHVLGIGGTLLIVKDLDDPNAKRVATNDSPDQYVLLFGIDMALSLLGDLQANYSTGDWQLESGLNNLVGALRRRILTRVGIYPFHPEYGSNLEAHVGRASDPVAATSVRLEAIQTVLNEPRVQSVRQVTLNADSEQVDVNILCDAIGAGSVVPLNIVIPR